MIPYKNISDNLNVSDFNAIVSLLRDNVLFNENIQITNSTVTGKYGDYVFNFNEATVLDNGILITNETLSNVGTVKLINPIFPNSNYFIDLKIISTEDVGVSGLDSDDVIVIELTIPLKKDEEVNIPFETLDMNNIVSFNANIRINHKDLIIRGTENIVLTVANKAFPNSDVLLTAKYDDGAGGGVAGKVITFYQGETSLGTATTDEYGVATLYHSWSSIGEYTVYASCETVISGSKTINIVTVGDMMFTITGSSFRTLSATPFVFSDDSLSVNFGDGSVINYTTGRLEHTYTTSGVYNVNILGEITTLGEYCFRECATLTSINLPNSITTLGNSCFRNCSGLTSINLPNSITTLGEYCFSRCTGLTSVNLPNSITTLGEYCFRDCLGLTFIQLNWDSANSIINYNSSWINGCSSFEYFLIPEGTTSLYTAKGYPSNLLREDVDFDGITITSDKDIIVTGETATITAQLTSQGQPASVSGETVTFEVRKQSDDSLIETLSDVTDSAGVATVSYLGQGTGDIYIKADCMLLTQTYSIEDCYRVGFKNTVFSTFPASSSGVNITDKTDESITFYQGGVASISQTILNSPGDDWEFSFTVLGNQVTTGGVSFGIQSNNEVSAVDRNSLKLETREYYGRKVINLFIGNSQYGHRDMTSNPQSYDVKFVKEGTTVKGYVDSSLITTVNNLTWLNDSMHILMRTWGSNTTFYQTISNFKIKKL